MQYQLGNSITQINYNIKIPDQIINSSKKCYFHNRIIVFTATFNNISVISLRSVLLVEETGIHGENHRPAAGD